MLHALAVAVVSLSAASAADAGARVRAGEAVPRLGIELHLDGRGIPAPLAVEPSAAKDHTPPPCVADWCQARVDVPGFGMGGGKAHKTELVVALLDRAHIEPLASIAWFFVVTGLRVDWTPASMDSGFGATAGGWGNAFVRLRFRIDAWNRPAVPMRPRDRMRLEHEHETEHAAEAASGSGPSPALAQRPARLSST